MHRSQVRQTVAAVASVALALGCSVVSRVPSASDPADGSSKTVEPAPSGADSSVPEGPVLRPDQFIYMGAFRLPQGGDRPNTFAYGGGAMTFRPGGDPGGAQDGF